jgi:Zn-dependent peptidase ImmA (M78 family)
VAAGHIRAPERVLAELGISDPEDIDLEAIAWNCGALVVPEPLTGCEARLLGDGDRAVIKVNANTRYEERRRFSIGHEIGHWMYDRAKASFRCTKRDFIRAWGEVDSPEKRANQYAADLLLPKSMFQPRVRGREMTLTTAAEQAAIFRTSLTSTAIRLVQLGSAPALVVCTSRQGVVWKSYGPDVRAKFLFRVQPSSDSVAYDLLRGQDAPGPTDVAAEAWFNDRAARYHEICEDSRMISPDEVLTILWWKDESHLLAAMGYARG